MTPGVGEGYAHFLDQREAFIRRRLAGATVEQIAEQEGLSESLTERIHGIAQVIFAEMGDRQAALQAVLTAHMELTPLANSQTQIELLTRILEQARNQLVIGLGKDEQRLEHDLVERQRALDKVSAELELAKEQLKKLKKWKPPSDRKFEERVSGASEHGRAMGQTRR
jgi:hypothetical protein